jgi:hypothetical protein
VSFVNVWGLIGDERVRDGLVVGSSRDDDVAETVRKVGVGVVVGRVRVSDVLYVGAGYVEEDKVVSDRVR